MAPAEVLAIEVGAVIAKYILKLWLKDASLGNNIASSIIDVLKSKTSDKLAQRKGNRQGIVAGFQVRPTAFVKFRGIVLHPPIDRGMIDTQSALGHHLF